MRDIALLAILYGISDISRIFNLEEKLLIQWIKSLGNDPFFKNIRKYILDQTLETDSAQIAKKYALSQGVMNQLLLNKENSLEKNLEKYPENYPEINSEENSEKNPEKNLEKNPEKNTELETIIEEYKKLQQQEIEDDEIIFSNKIDERKLIVDEWFIATDLSIVNTEDFLTNLNFGFHKPYKRVKISNKESMIAEVIREGTPLYKETALKYGLRPEKVKEWVQSYQANGTIKDSVCQIREASEIFKKAFNELEKEF